jgi:hypothetical protein
MDSFFVHDLGIGKPNMDGKKAKLMLNSVNLMHKLFDKNDSTYWLNFYITVVFTKKITYLISLCCADKLAI